MCRVGFSPPALPQTLCVERNCLCMANFTHKKSVCVGIWSERKSVKLEFEAGFFEANVSQSKEAYVTIQLKGSFIVSFTVLARSNIVLDFLSIIQSNSLLV